MKTSSSSRLFAAVVCLVVAMFSAGCGSLRPDVDGTIADFIPVSALEGPLNAVGSVYGAAGAGTAVVRADQALVQRYNPPVKPFPTIAVTTQFLDSTGAEVQPFFDAAGNPSLDMVETPEYGPRTTRLKLGASSPAPIVIDQETMAKALRLYNQVSGQAVVAPGSVSPLPSVDSVLPAPSSGVQEIPADVPEGFNAIRVQ